MSQSRASSGHFPETREETELGKALEACLAQLEVGQMPDLERLKREQATGKLHGEAMRESDQVDALSFGPGGRLLASGGHALQVSLWETESMKRSSSVSVSSQDRS